MLRFVLIILSVVSIIWIASIISVKSLKLAGFLVSFILIGVIFLRIPQESLGLSSFATKSDILGSSPSSAEQVLNILTAIGIFLYFLSAWMININ